VFSKVDTLAVFTAWFLPAPRAAPAPRPPLVDRYAPLVYTICIRYRLSNHDIEDVEQNVWLLLVEQLGKLREPAALPGWLATTHHTRMPARRDGDE
jgi:DNA-directed RNA polymerase specialized sigma24 family protein